MKYVIVNVPHASTRIPSNDHSIDLTDELNLCTDWFTDELIAADQSIIFPYSRLWCDVERLVDDPLETVGRGFYPTHTLGGKQFRKRLEGSSDWNMCKEAYGRHHFLLADAIAKANSYHDVILLDAHSYCDSQASGECPDVCLGFNGSEPSFIRPLKELFEEHGYSVGLNVPFGGAITSVERSESVMFEINKRLYLTENFQKSEGWSKTKNVIDRAVRLLQDS